MSCCFCEQWVLLQLAYCFAKRQPVRRFMFVGSVQLLRLVVDRCGWSWRNAAAWDSISQTVMSCMGLVHAVCARQFTTILHLQEIEMRCCQTLQLLTCHNGSTFHLHEVAIFYLLGRIGCIGQASTRYRYSLFTYLAMHVNTRECHNDARVITFTSVQLAVVSVSQIYSYTLLSQIYNTLFISVLSFIPSYDKVQTRFCQDTVRAMS